MWLAWPVAAGLAVPVVVAELRRPKRTVLEAGIAPVEVDGSETTWNIPQHLPTFRERESILDEIAQRTIHRETLALRQRILGPEHPYSLHSQNNLAIVLAAEGRLADAAHMAEETLEVRQRRLGPQHPHTLNSMNNLALIYAAQGRMEPARELWAAPSKFAAACSAHATPTPGAHCLTCTGSRPPMTPPTSSPSRRDQVA